MKKYMIFKFTGTASIKIIFLLVAVFLTTTTCKKDSEPDPSPVEGEIKQPLNPDDPAVLPATVTVIKKLEGNFSPLLTGVVANWRIKSHLHFNNDCWSDWETTEYTGTRAAITGKWITYSGCAFYTPLKRNPDFSGDANNVWGRYKKGVEQQDIENGEVLFHIYSSNDINFYRYYTVPDLPDAYILREIKWEVIQIQGSDYAWCEGCSSLEKMTSTTVGLSKTATEEWGLTLGVEGTLGSSFGPASVTVSASFNKQFSTSIQATEETTESLTLRGELPAGKSIIRLQAFREISTFKLVNADGVDYPGVKSPVLHVTTQIKNYMWYY
jgi:hypothetical protein